MQKKIQQTVILMSPYYHDLIINDKDGNEVMKYRGIISRIKQYQKYGYKQINNIQIHKPGKTAKGIAKYCVRFETTVRLSDSLYHKLLNEQNKPDEPVAKGLSFGVEGNDKFIPQNDRKKD